MAEKKEYSPSRKNYSTVVSVVFHMLWMLILISLIAWIVLLFLFFLQKNPLITIENIKTILNSQIDFIANFYPNYAQGLLAKIKVSQEKIRYASAVISSHMMHLKIHNDYIIKNFSNIMLLIFLISILVVIRLFIFFISLPFLFSLLFIAVVDGLSQRDIRKFQAARESAFYFHRIKSISIKIFYFFSFFYLSIPLSIYPLMLLFPMASLASITTMLTIKSYKKYL